jgi:hypothetical protein
VPGRGRPEKEKKKKRKKEKAGPEKLSLPFHCNSYFPTVHVVIGETCHNMLRARSTTRDDKPFHKPMQSKRNRRLNHRPYL